jgi:hypothetical protein
VAATTGGDAGGGAADAAAANGGDDDASALEPWDSQDAGRDASKPVWDGGRVIVVFDAGSKPPAVVDAGAPPGKNCATVAACSAGSRLRKIGRAADADRLDVQCRALGCTPQ